MVLGPTTMLGVPVPVPPVGVVPPLAGLTAVGVAWLILTFTLGWNHRVRLPAS
jgi:hypothetical protein